MIRLAVASVLLLLLAGTAGAVNTGVPMREPLYRLTDGETKQVNALWIENPPELKFGEGRTKVVIADLKGPGIITMIHFALPSQMRITRDVVLRIWWDGEKTPSVEAPLCDFFCDPNGALERVDSAFVNKKRGWNCYFPMPFAKSAKIEVSLESERYPNAQWGQAPCYSYVHYKILDSMPADAGYFHASWRQQTLLLGKEDYKVVEITGKGQWVGWNMSIHAPLRPEVFYPVDENVNFYIDGEAEPSIVWQGLEDGFGFSWGFPEEANGFPYTGYQPYYNGACAYRFNDIDRIAFKKSLRVTVGFGRKEHPSFRKDFAKPENALELSSVTYWYQKEPHVAFEPLPSASNRAPTLFDTARKDRADPNEVVALDLGSRKGDIVYLAKGWDFRFRKGYSFAGWPTEVNHCWADYDSLEFDLLCPKDVAGTLKLYIIDGDNFHGGRKQSISVAGRLLGEYESFGNGRWVEVPATAADTASGRVSVVAKNLKPEANAVISLVRFVEAKK